MAGSSKNVAKDKKRKDKEKSHKSKSKKKEKKKVSRRQHKNEKKGLTTKKSKSSFCCTKKTDNHTKNKLKRPAKLKKPVIDNNSSMKSSVKKTKKVILKKKRAPETKDANMSSKKRVFHRPPTLKKTPSVLHGKDSSLNPQQQQLHKKVPSHPFPVPPPHPEPWLITQPSPKTSAEPAKVVYQPTYNNIQKGGSERSVEMTPSKEKVSKKSKSMTKSKAGSVKKRDTTNLSKKATKNTDLDNSSSESLTVSALIQHEFSGLPSEQSIEAKKFIASGKMVSSWEYDDSRPINKLAPKLAEFLEESMKKLRQPLTKFEGEHDKGPCTCCKCRIRLAMSALSTD